MTSQRDRLLGRSRPSAPYRLLVDADAVGPAHQALLEAQGLARQAKLQTGKGRAATIRKAEAAVAQAQAALDACYEVITFTALEPAAVEALMNAHPPTQAQLATATADREEAQQRGERDLPDWPEWNEDTYKPAMLAACCDNGMTADDWATFLRSNLSTGERSDIWQHVVAVNAKVRVADPMIIPKELMQLMVSSRSS